MIYYNTKTGCGLIGLMFQRTGSVIPRSIPTALYSTVIALLFSFSDEHMHSWFGVSFRQEDIISHPYALQVFAIVFGYLLVLRTNLAYSRYWESLSSVEQMVSKWNDAIIQIVVFEENGANNAVWRRHFVHLGSLMASVAVHCLRGDLSVDSLTNDDDIHDEFFGFAQTFGHSVKQDSYLHKMSTIKAKRAAKRLSESKKQSIAQTSGPEKMHSPPSDSPWATLKATLEEKVFKIKKLGKNSRIHRLEKKAEHIRTQTMIRRLHELASHEDRHTKVIGGMSAEERQELKMVEVQHRVDFIMQRILRVMSSHIKHDGMGLAHPIVSRCFQEFSSGILGFNQAMKISTCPFPFPYVQMIAWASLMFTTFVPVAISVYTPNYGMAALLSFMVTLGYVSINEVAAELEEPFGTDTNDIPLFHILTTMNAKLRLALSDHLNGKDAKMMGVHPQETAPHSYPSWMTDDSCDVSHAPRN